MMKWTKPLRRLNEKGAILMKIGKIVTAALVCAFVFPACQGSKVKDPVVKVGKTTIGKEGLEAFKKVAGVYPAPLPHFFPNQRQPITFMAECEAIYQNAKSKTAAINEKITSSRDWEWKQRYYAATLFFDILGDNLGFTDAELEEYYQKNKESFRVTGQTESGEDSSFVPEFDAARRQAADILFYEKYKPDSAFIASIGGSDNDSAALRGRWLYHVRSNSADFFMRRFFFENTGEVYADSVEQMYGEGKYINSEDIDVIRTWLPENRKNMREKELVEWLCKWKSFSEHVTKKGMTANNANFKDMLHWTMRVEFARTYLQEEVLPKLPAQNYESDTVLAQLAIYDQTWQVEELSETRVQAELENMAKIRLGIAIDSVIYGIRKNVKVAFLQSDWRDDRSENPAALSAKADSLRDAAAADDLDVEALTAISEEAENLYRILTNDFAFTPEGRKAFNELAKIQIDKYNTSLRPEKYLLNQAIFFYRRGQVLDSGAENLCNSSFMTGFTYDEYLKSYSLAEANYKWILRNAPDCALASDAEFMMQHLDEPMTSIEEIQGQSMRQGRKIDFDDEISADEEAPAAKQTDGKQQSEVL